VTPGRPTVVLAMRPGLPQHLFDADTRALLDAVADVDWDVVVEDVGAPGAREHLRRAEVLLTGWGSPRIDAAVLDLAPRLGAIVHAAGSVKGHVDPVCWTRGLVVSTAADANALPVAEYTLAMIIVSGKRLLEADRRYRQERVVIRPEALGDLGNYRTCVGLVGASRIGRRVLELLRPFDFRVRLYDPTIEAAEADALGAQLCGLDELMAASDIVSLHAPAIPATRQMVDGHRLALMRDGATLINTARGSVVDTAALTAELVSGRLTAVLDVTDPEPLDPQSPLYDLPNVLLTPHVAGAVGNEVFRLGRWAAEEARRYLRGEGFLAPVGLADLERMA